MDDISFQNAELASQNLADIRRQVSPKLAAALPALLQDSPDPDSALILFDRLLSENGAAVKELVSQNPQLAHYALLVFGNSRFLGETLIHNFDVLQDLLRPKSLDQNLSREEFQQRLAHFRTRTQEKDVAVVLARFKRREYVRIMLRDLLRIASLSDTTSEISALSDVLLEDALHEANCCLRARYDPPRHLDAGNTVEVPFSILSLGKLGGNELNYCSDIDLMYLFGDGAEPPDASLSNREYFIRLAQQVTDLLSRVTSEGPVFRIDLRLRPQGREGELAISLGQALRYYVNTARDWERQAMIKLRYSAGDAGLAWQFIQGVQHHVYSEGMNSDRNSATPRQHINFAAIKTALVAREKIQKHSHDGQLSGNDLDVKRGSGGIRDIEFLVQCLQRAYGAHEPWLRSSGTLTSLHKLHDKRHISSQEFLQLSSAYEFLRHLEHRLQLREGRQTHRLPSQRTELQILTRAMASYVAPERRHQALDFVGQIRQRMAVVAEIYQRIIYQQQDSEHREAAGEFQLHSSPEPSPAERTGSHALDRLLRDAPALYETAARLDLDPAARHNLLRFLTSAFTSSERYAAVLRQQEAVNRALPLFAMSDHLTEVLVRHPEEISTIATMGSESGLMGSGYLFDSPLSIGRAASDPVFAYLAGSRAPVPEKMALLRRHFRHRVFASGAKDIVRTRAIYESLGELTSAAEDAIAAAWEIAGAPQGLAIMVLGRLGSHEFDVLSDADLIFICEEKQDRESLIRAALQIVQLLSAYTQEGMVFPIDTRLRPRGREGELVVTPSHLESYFKQEAQAWEALSYTKLRFVAGTHSLGERAILACRTLFERFAADTGFACSVGEMRTRLKNADAPAKNLKTSPGGIYDIDFLCGFLLLSGKIAQTGGTLRDRLWRCAAAGLLQNSEAAALDHAAELLRTVEHLVRLVTGRAGKWLPSSEHARCTVEKLAATTLGVEFTGGLEAELDRTCLEVRAIYESKLE